MMNRPLMLAALLPVASLFAGAGGDYLPRVGPAPLRFQAAQPASENKLPVEALPPLHAPEEEEKPEKISVPDPGDASQEPEPEGVLNATPNQAGQPTGGGEEMLSPQMLLKFFNGGATNGSGSSVYLPMRFTPPPAFSVPSSSATYKTSP